MMAVSQQLTSGHTGSVLCLDILDGEHVASGGENGELCVWSITGTLLQKYVRPNCDCTSVCFSRVHPNKLYAAFGEEILLFDWKNLQQPVHTFKYNEDEINQIRLNPDENYLAACDDSGEIKIVNIGERKLYKTLRHQHSNICSTICFHQNRNQEIISGGLDSKLIHWNFCRPRCVNKFDMQEFMNYGQQDWSAYMINPPLVHHVNMSPGGGFLACALENGRVTVFDSSRKHLQELYSLSRHEQGVSQVHFLNDTILFSGGNDCRIIQYDLNKAQEYVAAEGPEEMNGHCSPLERRDSVISGLCQVGAVMHPMKVNWLLPFQQGENIRLAVADQSPNISILQLPS